MQPDWSAVAAIVVALSAGFTAVAFVVRTESRTLNVQIGDLRRRVEIMEDMLEKIADFQGQLAVINERQLQSGKRQDEADKRANEMGVRLHEFRKAGS
jgi:hypothetical protein